MDGHSKNRYQHLSDCLRVRAMEWNWGLILGRLFLLTIYHIFADYVWKRSSVAMED